MINNSIMYRRTFDAVTRARNLCIKSKQRVVAPAEFEALAIDILQDDPTYKDFVIRVMEETGVESARSAQAVIVAVSNRMYGGTKPRGSSGELLVADVLESLGVRYEREKSFDGLSHIGRLRFDFYLPDHRTAVEYHGKQHFEPVGYFGGEDAHEVGLLRDEVKRQWCAANSIKLIEIRYDEDVASVMEQFARGL